MLDADETDAIRAGVLSGWVLFHSEAVAAGDMAAMDAIARSLGRISYRDGGALWPVTPRARSGTFSVTAESAGLHTDSQYHDWPEAYFLLFCVVPASCGGGANRLLRASDLTAHLDLPADDMALLCQDLWTWEVPEVFQPSAETAAANRHAVLGDGGTVRWRYDNLTERGPVQDRVAHRFHDYVESHPAVETQVLGAGDVLYCDNTRALHGRTAFQDPHRLLYRTRLW